VSLPDELAACTGFQWDDGNSEKNWERHQVSRLEAEQVFFNRPFVLFPDAKHSQNEPRFAVLGRTNDARLLTIVFTIRGKLIRVIMARDMHRRERSFYEQAPQQT
jgi:hypothetical protein